jgi:microcystin-dependent protein
MALCRLFETHHEKKRMLKAAGAKESTYLVRSSSASVVTEMGWRVATLVLLVVTVTLCGVCGWALWGSMDAEHRQNAEKLVVDALASKEQDDVNALVAADGEILAELLAVNASLTTEIEFLASALNLTNANGNTFLQEVQNEIANSVSNLDAAIALRMISVNYVDGDNATHNINLLPTDGITITPHAFSNTITLGNSGVLSLAAGNFGLSFSNATGNVVGYNLGVLSLSGILPPVLNGNIELLGAGMLSVYGDLNASTITVDASLLVTAVTNLQTQTEAQQAEISELQLNVTTLEQQITNIQVAEYMLGQALNGTVVTVNMTLTDLLVGLMQAQADIAALQAQLANQTQGTVIPTGAMMPWTGAVSTVPEGYLLCDGTEYLNTDWPALYTVIGTMYCEGNCSVGSFRVPPMNGRVPVGRGGGGLFQATIGTEVGSEQKTLTTPNLPSHTHTASTESAGNHAHTINSSPIGTLYVLIDAGDGSNPNTINAGTFNECTQPSLAINNCGGQANFPSHPYYEQLTGTPAAAHNLAWGDHAHSEQAAGTHSHTVNVGNTGSGAAFSVVQPSVVVQYIIKT